MTEPLVPPLIGLYSPAAQSGKSTVAGFLTEHGYYTISFAAPLKRMARTFLINLGYGPSDIDYYLTDNKEAVIPEIKTTPRHILRTLGTEWGRQCIHPELWLKCWEQTASRYLKSGIPVVCDDVRFPNEAALIRKLGGQMWHICRPGTERNTEHASEGSLDDYPFFDAHLVNNGTLTDLYSEVHLLLNSDPSPAAA